MEALIIGGVTDLLGQGLDLVKLSKQKDILKLDLRIKESLTYKSIFKEKNDRVFKIQLILLIVGCLFFFVVLIASLLKSKK